MAFAFKENILFFPWLDPFAKQNKTVDLTHHCAPTSCLKSGLFSEFLCQKSNGRDLNVNHMPA